MKSVNEADWRSRYNNIDQRRKAEILHVTLILVAIADLRLNWLISRCGSPKNSPDLRGSAA